MNQYKLMLFIYIKLDHAALISMMYDHYFGCHIKRMAEPVMFYAYKVINNNVVPSWKLA